MNTVSPNAELLRQERLLCALRSSTPCDGVAGAVGARAGLAVYRANAAATAQRALGAAFPVLAQLLGGDSFAALSRHFWRNHPPLRGDLAEWGGELPAFVAAQPGLADEPYLGDVAALEWAVHQAGRAADGLGSVAGVELLSQAEAHTLRIRFAPGCALIASRWPLVSIWQAHQTADSHNRFDAVREAFALQQGEHAWVARTGWRVQVHAATAPTADFLRAVLDGRDLSAALDASGEAFEFEPWLVQALQQRWIAGFAR
jgi:Putative DNA-binding domain